MMCLLESTPERLRLVRRTPVRAPALAGVALLALAVVPLAVHEARSPCTIVALTLRAGASLEVVRRSRARLEQVDISLPDFAVEGRSDTGRPTRPRAISLTHGTRGHAPTRLTYRAELLTDESEPQLLLERDEPAGVLADLSRLLRHVDLPLARGWGIPDGASPWEPNRPASTPAPQAARARARVGL